jgi:hypothetical protein
VPTGVTRDLDRRGAGAAVAQRGGERMICAQSTVPTR